MEHVGACKEVSFTIPNEDEEDMATAENGASKATKAVAKSDVKTITLSFEGKDLELHKRITAQAESEDRSASIELLRFVRSNFPKAQEGVSV